MHFRNLNILIFVLVTIRNEQMLVHNGASYNEIEYMCFSLFKSMSHTCGCLFISPTVVNDGYHVCEVVY